MKQLSELRKDPMSSEAIRKLGQDMIDFMFSKSQENLLKNMPWGDRNKPSGKKPTTITDKSGLLLSGVPPYKESRKRFVFEYTAPYARDVEYGSPPHKVKVITIQRWLERKLKIKGKGSWVFAKNIVKKIGKDGMPPHPYIRPTVSDVERRFKLHRIRVTEV